MTDGELDAELKLTLYLPAPTGRLTRINKYEVTVTRRNLFALLIDDTTAVPSPVFWELWNHHKLNHSAFHAVGLHPYKELDTWYLKIGAKPEQYKADFAQKKSQ